MSSVSANAWSIVFDKWSLFSDSSGLMAKRLIGCEDWPKFVGTIPGESTTAVEACGRLVFDGAMVFL